MPDDNAIRNKGLTLEITRIFVHIMPVDRLIESYFVEGIIPFHVEEMCQIAADTFGISLNIVMENVSTLQASDSKHVYFSLFNEELLNGSGHYLCWGSEYLSAIAGQLDEGLYGEYHDMLSNTGIPNTIKRLRDLGDIPKSFFIKYNVYCVEVELHKKLIYFY